MEQNNESSGLAHHLRDPRSFNDRPGEVHMFITPKEVQIGRARDLDGRRLYYLTNVPLDHYYIASQINDGDEFA